MYISEAIRQADALAPNEYTLNEKYAWCDELGAMLYQEYLKRYKKAVLEPDENGEYLLPEGITFEMVDKIIAQGREIEKYDFRSFGIRPIYGFRRKCYIPEHCQRQGDIAVIYLEQYQPIRTATLTVTDPYFGDDFITVEGTNFIAGDTVNVTFKDNNNATVVCENLPIVEIGEVHNYSIDATESTAAESTANKYMLMFPEGTFKDFDEPSNISECVIERVVTEETECPPPYDQMYIDWIIAKIAFYQNNFIVYNQQMNKFNQTIGAYHNWLMERRTQNKNDRVTGWW